MSKDKAMRKLHRLESLKEEVTGLLAEIRHEIHFYPTDEAKNMRDRLTDELYQLDREISAAKEEADFSEMPDSEIVEMAHDGNGFSNKDDIAEIQDIING